MLCTQSGAGRQGVRKTRHSFPRRGEYTSPERKWFLSLKNNSIMQIGEILFVSVIVVLVLVLTLVLKKTPWRVWGFQPRSWSQGLVPIVLFSIAVFFVVQLVLPHISLPEWVLDKDPIIVLLIMGACQEFFFRSLLVTWLEKWGSRVAIGASAVIFAATHLVLPDPWLMTGLSLVGGVFWGWHFVTYRNFYMLTLSHLVVNLSFNFLIFG